jgi:hypothetical protein
LQKAKTNVVLGKVGTCETPDRKRPNLQGEAVAVIVFVRRARVVATPKLDMSPGHASILINQKYVSWWPQGHNLPQSFNSGALHHKMSQDIKAEYGEHAAFTSAPLKGVDEKRMEKWADVALQIGPTMRTEFERITNYKLLSTNCAGIVLRALLVGTGLDNHLTSFVMNLSVPLPRDCEIAAKLLGG